MASIHQIHIHHTETALGRQVDKATVLQGGGIEGDSHSGGRPNRQVLVVSKAVLDEAGLNPGDLREQITVEGIDVDSLSEGTVLRFGDVTAEVLGECKPCLTIGGYLGVDDVEQFRDSMIGKRGMFVIFQNVAEGACIAVGDPVTVELVVESSVIGT